MSQITLEEVEFSVGGPPLLAGASLAVEAGERVCIVGRNGAGKSSLLRLIDKTHEPDAGRVWHGDGVVVARLTQAVPPDLTGSVFDVVSEGLGDVGRLIAEHHALAESVAQGAEATGLAELQARIDALEGWDAEKRIEAILSRFGLTADSRFETLSGGLRRRVLLARAVACRPDVLLLDEPTNHLDIAAITWLERFLREFPGSVIFVTHDRAFLQAVATRIVEIDRGRLTSWPGDYANYLRRRAERVHAEAVEQARFDRKLAQEEAWIRQGIKARRTRNEGRVRALQAMREARANRRTEVGQARLTMADSERSGRLVVEAEGVDYAVGGRTLVRDLNTRILRGDRVGIIGPNGAGKTTLLRLLLGEVAPQRGRVRLGSGLQVAYFDQQRAVLDDQRTARENVAGGEEFIDLGGGRRPHVMGYLQDFLFTPERANAPISRLSGGERNRLLLARLFARPANLLVLDEPTNDLDVETLELLEERLINYTGTLLLVSHDRAFLDNVVTSVLVPEGDGRFGEYVGGYADWLRQTNAGVQAMAETQHAGSAEARSGDPRSGDAKRTAGKPRPKGKLGYKAARELAALPARIEALEAKVSEAEAVVNDPALYQGDQAAIAQANERLDAARSELDAAYARWEALESEKARLEAE